jgi:hypothetical protein
VSINNSRCHNRWIIFDKMRRNHMIRHDYLPNSPDLSPHDVWLFGLWKNRRKKCISEDR